MASANLEYLLLRARAGGKQVISKYITCFIWFILLISTKHAAVLASSARHGLGSRTDTRTQLSPMQEDLG